MKIHLTFVLTLLAATACSQSTTKSGSDTGNSGTQEANNPGDDTGENNDPGDDSGQADDTGEQTNPDPGDPDAYTLDNGPCADGSWGNISSPETTAHIVASPSGHSPEPEREPGVAGDMNLPYVSHDRILTAIGEGDEISAIGLWPGAHVVESSFFNTIAAAGIDIEGCGAAEVTTEISADEFSESTDGLLQFGAGLRAELRGLSFTGDGERPLIQAEDCEEIILRDLTLSSPAGAPIIKASGVEDLRIRGVETHGGTVPIWTSGTASLKIEDVNIYDGGLVGIWTSGTASIIENVSILDTVPSAGMTAPVGGWGISINGGSIEARNLTVTNASTVGLQITDADVDLEDVLITQIYPSASGLFGRGIDISGSSGGESVELRRVTVSSVADAGIFIRNVSNTSIEDLTITEVAHAHIPGDETGHVSGDGMVLLQSTSGYVPVSAEDMLIELKGDTRLIDIARAGIIVDGSTLEMEPTITVEAGHTIDDVSVFAQNGGIISLTGDDEYDGRCFDDLDDESMCLNSLELDLEGSSSSGHDDTSDCE